jgi:spore coat protein SA
MLMARPRIVVVTPGAFEVSSERASSVEQVVRELCARMADKADIFIIGKSTPGFPSQEDRGGVTYIRVPSSNQAGYLKQAADWIRKLKADFVQVENRPRFVRYFKRVLPRIPVWLQLHSLTFMEPPQISRSTAKLCVERADRIIVNSHFLKEELLERCPSVSARIFVNHLGVDTARFLSRWEPDCKADREEQLRRMGYAGRKVILYAGRLLEIKGVHHLLQAMSDIVSHHPDALLLVVGSAYYGSDQITPYVESLHRLGNRLPAHVRFIPFVPHDEIPNWFRLADVVVVPSSEREAFGLVAVEAMASGVPVLATRAGGLQEIVEHERTGFLLEPAHLQYGILYGIHRLFGEEKLVKHMGEAAVQRVREQFTWEHAADRWFHMIQRKDIRRKVPRKSTSSHG